MLREARPFDDTSDEAARRGGRCRSTRGSTPTSRITPSCESSPMHLAADEIARGEGHPDRGVLVPRGGQDDARAAAAHPADRRAPRAFHHRRRADRGERGGEARPDQARTGEQPAAAAGLRRRSIGAALSATIPTRTGSPSRRACWRAARGNPAAGCSTARTGRTISSATTWRTTSSRATRSAKSISGNGSSATSSRRWRCSQHGVLRPRRDTDGTRRRRDGHRTNVQSELSDPNLR